MDRAASAECNEIATLRHAKYFVRFLNILPARLASHDSTRVTIAFFAVSGLDVLDALYLLSDSFKSDIVNWIYNLQVVPKPGARPCGGIQGSNTWNIANSPECCGLDAYRWGHLAITYTGIAVLAALGDDFSRLNRKAIIEGVAAVQREDGSFSATIEGSEHDMRFVYCAAAICAMLNDWGKVDKRKMADYIMKSIRYDYGISQHYEMESHGGTTFCAIAALQLSGQLHLLEPIVKEKIIRWLVFRQEDGFQGRPNKPVDTCYSFWIGATLKILDAFELTNYKSNRDYVMSTQDITVGGFSKWPGSHTDPFHTYFGICGLSFLQEPGLNQVVPSLNISLRAFDRLKQLHAAWDLEAQSDVRVNIE
ncbi:geranylgeranyl transferase type-1 subunit beta [Malaya genurostris]|uniref:geranylgeranyl transferase type-1 subunit beta n=1 Tax=Malaya genurostris TaxID=325434 RepID=UPI0026F39EB9|nr:geranylgeranyl transferase type-1 subunit beta [Malaya genurostris]XP_058448421.1 geranylgeranyl transferase type-1 subunit beta [Malaya genurostris]XP_058448422.1 geranylgeranyl transferase type-1 subunit beta [Malaya genurostris]